MFVRWQTTRGCYQYFLKCQNMHQHSCHEFLCLSLQVNNILSALKKNQCVRGMMVLWIQDTPISTAEMSPDDSGRFLRVKNCTSSCSQWVKDAKEISQGEIKLFRHHHLWKRRASSSSPLETHTHQTWKKKKGRRWKKRNLSSILCALSTQSCQYEGKWLFNILQRPPKWWERGDVIVTTAAVY